MSRNYGTYNYPELQENVNCPSLIHEQDELFGKERLVMCRILDKGIFESTACEFFIFTSHDCLSKLHR